MTPEFRKEVKEACSRLRLTHDGDALYRYLISELLDCAPPDIADGPLRAIHGRRNLARELIAMFEDESGSAGNQRTDRPAAATSGEQQPVRYARRGGKRRFVRNRDPAPGVGA
jgi:hypothetical protein